MTARTRKVDGRPETPAETRFFDLRESGCRGPIDQDGNPIPPGTETDILRTLGEVTALRAENEQLRAECDAANDSVLDLLQQLEEARDGAARGGVL